MVLAGFGLSVWILTLHYRRRFLEERPLPEARRGRGIRNTGLALVAAGLGLRQMTGADTGWPAIACALPVLTGLILVAIHATRLLGIAFDGEGRRRKE